MYPEGKSSGSESYGYKETSSDPRFNQQIFINGNNFQKIQNPKYGQGPSLNDNFSHHQQSNDQKSSLNVTSTPQFSDLNNLRPDLGQLKLNSRSPTFMPSINSTTGHNTLTQPNIYDDPNDPNNYFPQTEETPELSGIEAGIDSNGNLEIDYTADGKKLILDIQRSEQLSRQKNSNQKSSGYELNHEERDDSMELQIEIKGQNNKNIGEYRRGSSKHSRENSNQL